MTETAPLSVSATPFGERRTVARLWREAIAKGRTNAAYLAQEDEAAGARCRWVDAAGAVDELGTGLLALGMRKGDMFAILAQTHARVDALRPGSGPIGAVGVPIYANSAPRDAAYILEHSESVGVLCEDDAQLAKVAEHRNELPRLEHALTFADLDRARHPWARLRDSPSRMRFAMRSTASRRTTSSRSSTRRARRDRRRAA